MVFRNFKRTGYLAALAATTALVAPGVAKAADLSGELDFHPTNQGNPIIGQPGTDIRVENLGETAAEATADTLRIEYFTDDACTTGAPGGDTTATQAAAAVIDLTATVALRAGATHVIVSGEPAGDDFGAGVGAAVTVKDDGTFSAPSGAADECLEISGYQGIQLEQAQKDQSPSPEQVFLEFNADPIDTGSAGVDLFANNDDVIDADDSGGGGNGFADSIALLQDAGSNNVDAAEIVAPSPRADLLILDNDSSGTPFNLDPTDAIGGEGNIANTFLGDGAGNTYLNSTVPVTVLDQLAIAGVTAPAVFESAGQDIYDNAVAQFGRGGQVTVTVHFNQDLGGAFGADGDLTVVDSNGADIEARLNDGAHATTGSTATFTLSPQSGDDRLIVQNGNLFLVDDANSNNQFSQAELAAAEQVGVEFTAAGGVDALLGGDELNSDTTVANIAIGTPRTKEFFTADADKNGDLDGTVVAFNQPVSVGTTPDLGFDLAVNGAAGVVDGDADTGFIAPSGASLQNVVNVGANNPVADSAVLVNFNEGGDFDWDDNGTAGEAADDAAFDNFDTASTSEYDVRLPKVGSDVTYQSVFDPATGELLVASIAGFTAVNQDGAAPVVTQAELDTQDGEPNLLTLTASEPLAAVGAGNADPGAVTVDDTALPVLNINANADGAPENQAVAGGATTVTIEDIANVAVGQTVDILPDPPFGVVGQGDNLDLTTDADGEDIVAGTDNFTGPEFIGANAVVTDDKITEIVVRFDKDVQIDADAGEGDKKGLFKARVQFDGPNQFADISFADADVAITGSNVTLTLPDNGLIRENVQDIIVEYQGGGQNPFGNQLESTDANPTPVQEQGAPQFNFGFGEADTDAEFNALDIDDLDEDTAFVSGTDNTNNLFTQTIEGTLSGVAAGTLVRADVLGMGPVLLDGPGSRVTFPSPFANAEAEEITTQLQFDANGTAQNAIARAKRLGLDQVDLALSINDELQAMLMEADSTKGAAGEVIIPVNVDLPDGDLDGPNIDGQLDLITSLDVWSDPAFTVVTDPANPFRVTVGTDWQLEDAFVNMAFKEPGSEEWVQFTRGGDVFANYVPFAEQITSGNSGVTDIGTIDTTNLEETDLGNVVANEWFVAGRMGGSPALMGGGAPDGERAQLAYMMVGINPVTGGPVRFLWDEAEFGDNGDLTGGGNDDTDKLTDNGSLDEMFTLNSNDSNPVDSYTEVTATTRVNNIDNDEILPAGVGFALRQSSNAQAGSIWTLTDGTAPQATMVEGWHLITMNGTNIDPNIDMVIEAGNNADANVWTAADGGTPDFLQAGDTVFVHFSAQTPNFAFGL